jgi:ribosome assembly protein YihI (activator of Der GTPase)
MSSIEINEQADVLISELQVGEELSAMDRQETLDRFEFN